MEISVTLTEKPPVRRTPQEKGSNHFFAEVHYRRCYVKCAFLLMLYPESVPGGLVTDDHSLAGVNSGSEPLIHCLEVN